jgi:DNA repair exonuclease SbcCD ATPase subunit
MTKFAAESIEQNINSQSTEPKQSVEELKSAASEQLKKILEQNKKIEEFNSDMQALMAQIQAEQSVFGKLALWYGDLSWWVKLIHIAVVGALCYVSLVVGLVVLALYSIQALLFTDYYNVVEKQNKLLYANIVALEQSLAEAVGQLGEIEDSLKKVFTTFCEMNIAHADDIGVFKEHISKLEEQIQLLNSVTTKVSQTTESLADSTTKFSQVFAKSAGEFGDLNESMSTELNNLKQTDVAYSDNIDLLIHDHQGLSAVNLKLNESNASLILLASQLSAVLGQLKLQGAGKVSLDDIPPPNAHGDIDLSKQTKDIISQADDTVAAALKLMEEYQQEQTNAVDCSPSSSNPTKLSNLSALLSRAQNAISAHDNIVHITNPVL